MSFSNDFTQNETRSCEAIIRKERSLRGYLKENEISEQIDPAVWFEYLIGIKHILGNFNNDIAFTATLLVKRYLKDRFAIDFDASAKAQGARGIDIEAKTADGRIIIGELKTTKPYQPGFGAKQRTEIVKDLKRLTHTPADYRFMFVTDADTFRELTGKAFKEKIENIEIVNLIALNEKTWMAGTSPAMTVHQKSEAADAISIALRLR